jgi:nucleotide-binding universal stress UspA family protein
MRTPHHPVPGVGRLDPEQARLACRADTAPTRETPMKILVAVDGSPYTKRMLAYLAAHDDLLGPKHDYTVVHSVLAVPHRAAAFVGTDVVRKFYEDDAEAVFRPVRTFFEQQGIQATYVHTVSHAAESIAKLATDGKFDLLVMGSHGHGELANLVLGSVVTRVLAKCSTPVLLIR